MRMGRMGMSRPFLAAEILVVTDASGEEGVSIRLRVWGSKKWEIKTKIEGRKGRTVRKGNPHVNGVKNTYH